MRNKRTGSKYSRRKITKSSRNKTKKRKERKTKGKKTKRRKKNQIKQRRAGMFSRCCPPPRTHVPPAVEDGSLEVEPEPERGAAAVATPAQLMMGMDTSVGVETGGEVVRARQSKSLVAQDKLEGWLKSHSLGQYSRKIQPLGYDTVGDLLKFDEDQLLTIGRDAGMPLVHRLRFKNQLMNLNIPLISAEIAEPDEKDKGYIYENTPEGGTNPFLTIHQGQKLYVIIPLGAGPGQRLRIDKEKLRK